MSPLRLFINFQVQKKFAPNLLRTILTRIRNWEILRLTSLIKLAVSTADIWPENVKPESPVVDINSSS